MTLKKFLLVNLCLFNIFCISNAKQNATNLNEVEIDSLIIAKHDTPLKEEPLEISLNELIERESNKEIKNDFIRPSEELYAGIWVNDRAHVYNKISVPNSFSIDLRGFTFPTKSNRVTSNFGYRPKFKRFHKGVDIALSIGDSVMTSFDGVIRVVGYDPNGYGNFIVVRHYNGLETIYGHLSKALVKPNQMVISGEVIGLGGNTGRSTGPHLHYETRFCGVAMNPTDLISCKEKKILNETYKFVKDK